MDLKAQQYNILYCCADTYGEASLELVNKVSIFIEFLKSISNIRLWVWKRCISKRVIKVIHED